MNSKLFREIFRFCMFEKDIKRGKPSDDGTVEINWIMVSEEQKHTTISGLS